MKGVIIVIGMVTAVAVGFFLCFNLWPWVGLEYPCSEGHAYVESLLPWVRTAESGGDSRAVSPDGRAWGLYQITSPVLVEFNEAHGSFYGLGDLYNAKLNEHIARWYLNRLNRWLGSHGYKNDTPRLILAYNWGMGNLKSNEFRIPDWARRHPNRTYRKLINEMMTGLYKNKTCESSGNKR